MALCIKPYVLTPFNKMRWWRENTNIFLKLLEHFFFNPSFLSSIEGNAFLQPLILLIGPPLRTNLLLSYFMDPFPLFPILNPLDVSVLLLSLNLIGTSFSQELFHPSLLVIHLKRRVTNCLISIISLFFTLEM